MENGIKLIFEEEGLFWVEFTNGQGICIPQGSVDFAYFEELGTASKKPATKRPNQKKSLFGKVVDDEPA